MTHQYTPLLPMNTEFQLPQLLIFDGTACYYHALAENNKHHYLGLSVIDPDEAITKTLDLAEIEKAQLEMLSHIDLNHRVQWGRHSGYECSSAGDKRFSALFAIMPDGRPIESWYQCGCHDGRGKMYDPGGNDWRIGKGRGPKTYKTTQQSWEEYYSFWKEWLDARPFLVRELYWHVYCSDYTLSYKFASSPVSQARALAQYLNDYRLTLIPSKETSNENSTLPDAPNAPLLSLPVDPA